MSSNTSLLSILGAALLALGFNTLDAMIWNFYWHDWKQFHPGLWALTPSFLVEPWTAYFFLGILPLAAGSFFLGFVFGKDE